MWSHPVVDNICFLVESTQEKELDIQEVREALVKSGRPKLSVIDFDNSGITRRLTDFTNYPHRHRTRFDSNGQCSLSLSQTGPIEVRGNFLPFAVWLPCTERIY